MHIATRLSTDVRIDEVQYRFTGYRYRAPYMFGGRVVDRVTLLDVRCRVTSRTGRSGWGFGSMTLGNQWAFPSAALTPDTTLAAMQALAIRLSRLTRTAAGFGHPLDHAVALEPAYAAAAVDVSRQLALGEPMPRLCALVVASPFDAAIHDAFARLHGRNVFDVYGSDLLPHDLGRYLGDDFAGERLDRALLPAHAPRLPVFHSVGALDPLDDTDVTTPVGDGLPETLGQWIERDGLFRLKIKLNGDELDADVARILAVDRVAMAAASTRRAGTPRDFAWCLDFNERCPDAGYVIECLQQVRRTSPDAFARILYIEQPTPRDLAAHPHNTMHEAARLRPVIVDESLTDLESLHLAREMGYTGVALKACKGQTHAVLMAAAAQRLGLFVTVQDLTCPGASLLQSVAIAARVPGAAGIEANARQYVPAANRPWEPYYPGVFRIRGGVIETTGLDRPGFGVPDELIDEEGWQDGGD